MSAVRKGIVLILMICSSISWSQDLTLHFMKNVHQVQFTNPAFMPGSRVNIGLPGAYLHHINTSMTPDILFETGVSDATLRVDHFREQLKKRNYLSASARLELLSFGFKINESYFSFSATEHLFSRLTLPKDFLIFPFTGNASFDELENGTLDFSGFAIDLNHYRDYSFGYQQKLNDKWSIGGKLKLLYGMENIRTVKSDMTWVTDEDEWDWTINGDFQLNTSGVYSLVDSIDDNHYIEQGEIGSYLFKKNNYGLGIDLGATYNPSEALQLSASIVDLGFITWKEDNRNFSTSTENFIYDGIDFTEVIYVTDTNRSDTLNRIVNDFFDDLGNEFNVDDNTNKYRGPLLTRFYLGATYEYFKKEGKRNAIGALFQGEVYHGTFRPSLTLSYTYGLNHALESCLTYSIMNRDAMNIGFGLALNLGPFQTYIVSDNLLAFRMANIKTGDGAFRYPDDSKTAHIRFGINLNFARGPDDIDGDGIKNKHDECPEVPGLAEYNGCPDTDKDGVPDNKDACPRFPGEKQFDGCPDTDLDGIQDNEDDCKVDPGIAKFKGCPDTDKDGIQDKEDDCPKKAGPLKFKGCPDTDGDGILDSKDACPDRPGKPEHHGCPDNDHDGIWDDEDDCPDSPGPKDNKGCPYGDQDDDGLLDKDDKCPNEYGPKENDGCPVYDFDKDGISDNFDHCPRTPGTLKNKGCPEINKEEKEILNTAFSNLEFKSGKAIIKEESFASLNELAKLLKKKSDWGLQLSGHTDNVGSSSINKSLSEKRAKAVAKFLSGKGVNSSKIKVEWFGEEKPIASNKTEEGRQKNRRVEMKVLFE